MRRRALGQVILGLVLVAVLVFVLINRDRGDDLAPATTIASGGTTTGPAATPSTEATTTTLADAAAPTAATTPTTTTTATPTTTTAPATASTTAPTTSTTAGATTTTLADAAGPEYAAGLAEARRTLTLLVEGMADTNRVFDNRHTTGPDYRMTRDAIRTVVAGVRALAGQAAAVDVPTALADLHEGSGGPIELTARLVPLAESVLAGLRLPFPEDGSARRAALADYAAASEGFETAINELIDRVRDDPGNLGVATTENDTDGLAEDAALYLEELSGLTGTATRLLGDLTDASRAWDGQLEIGASYRQTEAALLDIIDRTRTLEAAVRNLTPPVGLADLHEGPGGPIELAGELSTLAQDVLAGLRLPQPDDGSDRRAAAAGYAAAAARFDAIADQLISQSR
ncbi:MAG: hypothetical protein OXM57_12420 [bacterium]|nr:hypothetical protein [bacterium]MDE0353485.1 hypothetical protein [bacterium]